MTALFRHNNPLALLLLAILSGLPLFQPALAHAEPAAEGFSLVHDVTLQLLNWMQPGQNKAGGLFSAAVLLLEALYLNKVVSDQKLLDKPGLIPAFSFLLLCSLSPLSLHPLSLLNNALIIIGIKMMIMTYKQNRPQQTLFLAGLLAGILASQHTVYLLFYCWLFIATLIMRPLSTREWLLSTAGFIMPFYWLVTGLYLGDHLNASALFPPIDFQWKLPVFPIKQWAVFSCIILLPLISLFRSGNQLGKMVIQVRKSYLITLVLYLAIILILLAQTGSISQHLTLLLVPSAILLAPFFTSFKRDHVPNLLIILLITLALLR